MARILLVEDNEMNRDMLSRRLARRGFEVLIAENGQSGVELTVSERPDLVLMDMSLPVMDGWEATRRLKADPDTSAIPDHRAHCACDGERPRNGARGRLRRLRQQAGGPVTARAQDRTTARRQPVSRDPVAPLDEC